MLASMKEKFNWEKIKKDKDITKLDVIHFATIFVIGILLVILVKTMLHVASLEQMNKRYINRVSNLLEINEKLIYIIESDRVPDYIYKPKPNPEE